VGVVLDNSKEITRSSVTKLFVPVIRNESTPKRNCYGE